MQITKPCVLALCDFNGTVVDRDMIRLLADEAGIASSPFERGTRDDINYYVQRIHFERDDAESRIDRALLFDQSFLRFERACAAADISLVVATSGIRELVSGYLHRRGIEVPVYASEAEMQPAGWQMQFHDDSIAGIDKAAFAKAALRDGRRVVVIGDDRSDFEAALVATTVFAKSGSPLQQFLIDARRPHHAFLSFDDILARWPPATW